MEAVVPQARRVGVLESRAHSCRPARGQAEAVNFALDNPVGSDRLENQNIYQSVKGMTAAEATAREGAWIIMVSACNDGHGGETFYRIFLEADAGQVMERILATGMEDTVPDQWESQILARILMKHQVIMVTDQCDPAL